MDFLQSHKRTIIACTGSLLLLLLLGYLWAGRGSRQVVRVKELQKQLSAEAAKNLSTEQRQALFRDLGKQMKELTPAQRKELLKDRKPPFEDAMDRYFSLPKSKQVAFLDEQINRMEAARKKWEADKTKKGGGAGVAKGAAGKAGPGGNQGKSLQAAPAKKTLDPQERERRKREWLDQSTPEQRARRAEFFKALNARRQQRGLAVMGFGFRK